MDAPTQLWEAWRVQVKQLFPHLHRHQQKTLAWIDCCWRCSWRCGWSPI